MSEEFLSNYKDVFLSREKIKKLKKGYIDILARKPFPSINGNSHTAVLKALKRDLQDIGPYSRITVFEAANRIATDLVMIDGLLQMFTKRILSERTVVKIRFGTMQEKGRGDFTVKENGKEKEGESFSVATSFFKSKLYKTLSKWKNSDKLRYIIFNGTCLDDSGNKKYFETKKSENQLNILFVLTDE